MGAEAKCKYNKMGETHRVKILAWEAGPILITSLASRHRLTWEGWSFAPNKQRKSYYRKAILLIEFRDALRALVGRHVKVAETLLQY